MSSKKFKVSDETINSKGIIVRTAGIKIDRFLKNPVMLNFHDKKEVYGRWDELEKIGAEMFAKPVFDLEDPEAAKTAGKVERGFMKGCSLGIKPIEFHYDEKLDAIDCTVSELREISICSIPSNENSLTLYDDDGLELSEEGLLKLKDNLKPKNIQTMKNLALMAKVLNLAADTSEDEILLAVQRMGEQNTALQTKVTKMETAAKEMEQQKIINLVDGAIKENKILVGEKDDYLKLATADYDTTKKLLDAKTPHVSIGSKLGEKKDADKTRADWTFDDYSKKDPDALAEMRQNNKDEFERLYKAKFKK
jgi:HK97 family phage prohead protease